MHTEFAKLRSELTRKLSEIHFVMSTSRVCSTHSARSAGRSADSLKRNIPEAKSIEYLSELCERERYQPPLAQYLMMLSVFCFVVEIPQLNSWIPPRMKTAMGSIRSKLGDVSGFSIMYFSKTRDDKGTKFSGRIGTLWSWAISSTIVAIILAGRSNDFEKQGKDAPAWMTSFGSLMTALENVEPIVESLERHNVIPLAKEVSKRQKTAEARFNDALNKDPVRGEREQAVDTIRSLLLGLLTDGRLKSRQLIFSTFMFVIEAMDEFDSVADARAGGFDIILAEKSTPDELNVPVLTAGTVWDIPKTRTDTPADTEARNANVKAFKEASLDKFGCMNGHLKLRKSIICTADASNDAEMYPEVSDPNLQMQFTEPFNLHRVAMAILVDMYGLKHFYAVLSCSALALRVIYIVALALRGLIQKAIGEELLTVEEYALREVTHIVLDRSNSEDTATVAMGSRAEPGTKRKDSAILTRLRKSKREMSWDDYKVEKNRRRIETPAPAVSEANTSSSGNQNTPHGVIDMSWIDGSI